MFDCGVAIIDFGSQFTRLIRRRLEQLGVRSAIFTTADSPDYIASFCPKALVLSGGPFSVVADDKINISAYLAMQIPILAICYGMQAVCSQLGGRISSGKSREYGAAEIDIADNCGIFANLPNRLNVWMSHSDTVEVLPDGFKVSALSENGYIVAASDDARGIHCVQFHPEVTHTQHGSDLLYNFAVRIAGCNTDWHVDSLANLLIEKVRDTVPGKAIAGVSGGIDSSVAAHIVHTAIGDRLTCVFVDNGLMRAGEPEQVKEIFAKKLAIPLVCKDASELFLSRLAGVTDPEQKRKIIGRTFIEVFEECVGQDVDYLVQGTLYPDVVESLSGAGTVIKSHHNVGGLPETMRLKIVEPLRELFKDEAREVGRSLGIPNDILDRHPFPGPGLAIRIIGEVTRERLDILRKADYIFINELRSAGLYSEVWQALVVLMVVNTVGVMGDGRSYEYVCALRAVESVDGMTARASALDHSFLQRVASKIVNNVPGISRVVYDVTSKPPASIEWE